MFDNYHYSGVCPDGGLTPGFCSAGSALISDQDAARIRVWFTTAFRLLGFVVAIVGSFVIKRYNQRRVLKDEQAVIPLHKISPWMSAVPIFLYSWRAGRMPGGRWGYVMLSFAAFGLLTEYFINIYITRIDYPGNCGFDRGVVVQPIGGYVSPPISWEVSQIALNSQNTSHANRVQLATEGQITKGNPNGIFLRATTNQSFFARDDDVLGGWSCSPTPGLKGNMQFYNVRNQSLVAQLKNRGVVFNTPNSNEQFTYQTSQTQSNSYQLKSNTSTDYFVGALGWSISPNSSTVVRFGVCSELQPFKLQAFNITALECRLNAGPVAGFNGVLDNIWNQIDPYTTISNWQEAIAGYFCDYPPEALASLLERHLNAMVMAAGSYNKIQYVNASSPTIIGCMTPRAQIDIRIWVLLTIELVLLFAFLLMDFAMLTLGSLNSRWKRVKGLPSDLLDWEVAFVNDRSNNGPLNVTAADLKDWGYGWDENGKLHFRRLGFYGSLKIDDDEAPLMTMPTRTKATVDTEEHEMPSLTRPSMNDHQGSFMSEHSEYELPHGSRHLE